MTKSRVMRFLALPALGKIRILALLAVAAVALALPVSQPPLAHAAISNLSVVADPADPGDPAEYTIHFTTSQALTANTNKIFIIFDKDIQLPATLERGRVTIQASTLTNPLGPDGVAGTADDPSPNQVVNPTQDPVVRTVGPDFRDFEIAITVPDMDPSQTTLKAGTQDGIAANAVVTIKFAQGAGIRNPTEGGTDRIVVTTDAPGEFSRDNGATAVAFDGAQRTAAVAAGVLFAHVTPRIINLSAVNGQRGSKLTIVGRGFKDGTTATAWMDTNGNLTRDVATETDLCSAAVGSDDRFTCTVTVTNPPFIPGRVNNIAAVDGRNNRVTPGRQGVFTLLGSVTVTPTVAAVGDRIIIQVQDFDANCDLAGTFPCAGYGAAPRINLGGVLLDRARFTGTTLINAQGEATFTGVVPNGVPLGAQALEVRNACCGGVGSTRRVTMTVGGGTITLTPQTALANQTLSIIGSGYTTSELIAPAVVGVVASGPARVTAITIEGVSIADVKVNDSRGVASIAIDSGGNWSTSLVVPVTTTTTTAGSYELQVTDNYGRVGVATLLIPPRTLTVNPPSSIVGSIVAVTGSGYPVSNSKTGAASVTVTVEYRSVGALITTLSVQADALGNIQGTLTVPQAAGIPSTNTVLAEFRIPDDFSMIVVTTTTHLVPAAALEVTPSSGPPGTRVTVTGRNFRPFARVDRLTIGDLDVTPSPVPVTDGQGSFTASFTVPSLIAGVHQLRIIVAGLTTSTSLTVTAGTVTGGTTITGTVTLQGRTATFPSGVGHGIATVSLSPGGGTVSVNAAGSFQISNVPAGNYTLTASAPGYVSRERTNVVVASSPVPVPPVQLRCGLVNNDSFVNINDITATVASFGTSPASRVDVQGRFVDQNGDGFVNINDITCVVSGFGKTSPEPWE